MTSHGEILTHFPLVHPRDLRGRHLPVVQPVGRAGVNRSSLESGIGGADELEILGVIKWRKGGGVGGRRGRTCVIEPPGLLEEMSGGGSGMASGRTAASRPASWGIEP